MTAPRPCVPEEITAFVDGALDEDRRLSVEEHLRQCEDCRDQAAFERGLRLRLRALPAPAPPPGLEERTRAAIARTVHRRIPAWLLVAASLFVALLWGRGAAPFVAWELWRDHHHCFDREKLPAQVWTDDPARLAAWFRDRGTELPPVPPEIKGVELVGGRYCPLLDRRVAHVYYSSRDRHVSLYVVPGSARIGAGYGVTLRGNPIRLLRTSGVVLGVVGDDAETVDAFRRAFATTVARSGPADELAAPSAYTAPWAYAAARRAYGAAGLTPPPGL